MRNPTKATIGVITLGILAGSYQAGLAQAANQTSLVAAGTTDPNASSGDAGSTGTASAAPSAVPTTDSTAGVTSGAATGSTAGSSSSAGTSASTRAGSSSNSSSNTTSGSSTSSGSSSSSSSGSSSSGSSSTGSSGSSGSSGASSTVSHTGSAISYRYGTMQVEVVKTGTKITAINLIQATARGRQYEQVPGMLIPAAIAANGTNFGSVSGATFTSEAFRSALESALAQF
ncbi:MAG: hypothetical protein KGL77_04725 [Actinomycetales bacterium]|nr:hypothetical protein [Actinomycetales bacterium]